MITNGIDANKIVTAGLNATAVDAADAKENEAIGKNETSEDNVVIDSVTFSPSIKYIELKNNETSEQNLTGWKLDVLNKTVFTFPQIHAGSKC